MKVLYSNNIVLKDEVIKGYLIVEKNVIKEIKQEYDGEFEDWVRNADRIVQKYGSHSLYLFFPDMPMEQAEKLIAYAKEHWSDVQGTFQYD